MDMGRLLDVGSGSWTSSSTAKQPLLVRAEEREVFLGWHAATVVPSNQQHAQESRQVCSVRPLSVCLHLLPRVPPSAARYCCPPAAAGWCSAVCRNAV
jgi:hypothetical protein